MLSVYWAVLLERCFILVQAGNCVLVLLSYFTVLVWWAIRFRYLSQCR